MSLFTRLFNKAPPPSLGGRSATPGKVSSDGAQRVAVAAPADGPQDDAPRIAAVGKLGYGEALIAATLDTSSIAVQGAAQRRLLQLMESDDVNDVDILAKLAIDGPSTRVRQLAAEKVDDPARLRKLLKEARGKDKNVFKIIKGKCDAINAVQRQAEEAHAAIIALGEAIERHSFRPFDGAFLVTLDHFNTQWNAVAAQAPEELRARVTHAIGRGREVIGQHLRIVAAQAAQASAIENADAQRRTVLEEMRKQLVSLYAADSADAEAASAATAQLTRWSERWHDASRYKAANPVDSSAFESLRNALPQLLQKHAQHGTLRQQVEAFHSAAPDADLAANCAALRETLALRSALPESDVPAIVGDAEALLQEWQKSRTDKEAAAANELRQLGGIIRRALRALDEGKSAQATGMRRSIAESLAELPSVPRSLSAPLEQLDKRLGELQDWKSFAVTPKRAQLIEQMEALVGSKEPPTELAERIKKLQDEWKSISKGAAAAQSEADWDRFHRAAQAAYQPCREFFAEQSRARHENLEKRRKLAAELTRYEGATDWDNPNWRDVAKRLRNARQDWRNFSPTERAATKPVQEEFDTAIGKLQVRMDAEYSANVERKKALMQQAEGLVGETDTRKAIDEIKRLQSVWKSVGLVPHYEDQKLWEKFRQHCDAVYKKSQEQYTQFVAELDINKAKALALCAEAEQLATASGAALLEGVPRIKQLREEFGAVGDLPRAEANEIFRKFDRALERFDAAIAQQRVSAESQRWENLLAASSAVRQVQLAMIESGADSDAVTAQRESARAFIDSVPLWPKGGQQAVENKLATAAASDIAANETALRLLCIRAEILTDITTPAVDQALRRNHQLQSLVQGIGRSSSASPREQMEAMLFEWIAVGATPTSLHDELLGRFQQCWIKARHQNAARR